MRTIVTSPKSLRAAILPPGDKSIAHRSLILNAAAVGRARVTNFPRGGDTLATLACLRAMGLSAKETRDPEGVSSTIELRSTGIAGLTEPERVLDARNSGTTMRFLLGLLAAAPLTAALTGDRSLRRRPMGRVAIPLRLMGAQIWGRADGSLAPLMVRGTALRAIDYRMPVASAQLKSALLLAGLSAVGTTVLEEPAPSRDHTELILRAMGIDVASDDGHVQLKPGIPKAIDIVVPADISGAAPWLVAGSIHPDARLLVRGVGINPTRTGVLDVLREMGAKIRVTEIDVPGAEPIADIEVESSDLRGIDIGGSMIPRVIDELPVLALAATQAEGVTTIRNAEELRVKESDRVAATVRELSRLGARIEERPDGMVIYGRQRLTGTTVRSGGDHRLAMTLAIAGLIARGDTIVEGAEAVTVSYPGFWSKLATVIGA